MGRRQRIHGRSFSREHKAWCSAKERCHTPTHAQFASYGDRGISVCPEWRNDFLAFFAYIGQCPDGHSLDRINNDGNYEPGNVRWATRTEQQRNRRTNHLITHNGVTACITEWAHRLGVPRNRLVERFRHGWSTERALTT
jgi:hypothetical protein